MCLGSLRYDYGDTVFYGEEEKGGVLATGVHGPQ
jgi:hypothetical protein